MKDFFVFLQNGWVIGIVGGIISGIIVYFITNKVLDSKKKNDYKRNIILANNEVLTILRPYIANSGLPTKQELNVIIKSVARTYNIIPDEMKTVDMFYGDLVVEFVENLYIPNNIKQDSIYKILEALNNESDLANVQEKGFSISETKTNKKSGMSIMSLLLGILSGVVSLLAGLFTSINMDKNYNIVMWIITILILVIAIIINLIIIIKSYKNRIHSYRIKEIKEIDNIRMMNCGKDLNTIYNHDLQFIDYFKGCD